MTLDFLAAVRRDGARFADLLDGADLSARVPSCPEWTVADLGHHLAEVYRFWATVVAERLTDPEGMAMLPRPHDSEVPAEFGRELEHLIEVLTTVPSDTPVWAWWGRPTGTAAQVTRRMAHETTMHRWDLEHSVGEAASIDAELASDGIDEVLSWVSSAPAGSVHLHCTDVAGEWTLFPDGDGVRLTREHAKGDCALRGTSNDLLLAIWRRVPVARLDIVGDGDVARAFLALAAR
jgi:uncharacterized protein (TIGR03083 family)